jgi:hypothetical protein
MQSETPRQASLRKPTILRKSEAPALAPNGLPDCDDGPIGLAARRQAETDGSFYAANPTPADPNSSLIDELERILQGDFAEAEQDEEDSEVDRFPRFAADPLSLFDEDAPADDDEGPAPYARSRPAEKPRTPPSEPSARAPATNPERYSPDVFDVGDRDEFGFFDEDPPRTPDFWRTTDLPSADLAPTYRRRRGFSRGYLTVSALLLLVAAGAIYSTVQFRGAPASVLADGTEIASPNAFGSPAVPRLVETTTVTAPVEPPPAEIPATTGDEIDRLAELAATPNAAPVTEEPAAVPLFREPADTPALAETATPPEPAVAEAAATEPAPAAAAETPPPPAAPAETTVANTNLGTINDWVNLRADPSMNGRVLMVVPLGATVEVIGCPGWCEVVYNGTRGFVGPDFVDRR